MERRIAGTDRKGGGTNFGAAGFCGCWDLRSPGFAAVGICSLRDLGPPGVQVAECFPLAGGGWEAKNRIFPVGTEGFYDMGVGFEK